MANSYYIIVILSNAKDLDSSLETSSPLAGPGDGEKEPGVLALRMTLGLFNSKVVLRVKGIRVGARNSDFQLI